MKYLSLISLLGLPNATGLSLLKELRAKKVQEVQGSSDFGLEVYINGVQQTMAQAVKAGGDNPAYLQSGWDSAEGQVPMKVYSGCKGVIKMEGSSCGDGKHDGVKFTPGGYIKTVTINMVAGAAAATALTVNLYAGNTVHYLGLDGDGKSFFVEGGNWGGAAEVGLGKKADELLKTNVNYVSVVLALHGNKVTSAKLNGVEAWGTISKEVSGSITAVGIRPWRNSVWIPAVKKTCGRFP